MFTVPYVACNNPETAPREVTRNKSNLAQHRCTLSYCCAYCEMNLNLFTLVCEIQPGALTAGSPVSHMDARHKQGVVASCQFNFQTVSPRARERKCMHVMFLISREYWVLYSACTVHIRYFWIRYADRCRCSYSLPPLILSFLTQNATRTPICPG
jgi:hypothetical protein